MGNFARSVRLALRYYWTVAASGLCALIVAALWGANIGAIYPLVEVIGNDQSLTEFIDKGIDQSEKAIAEETAAAGRLQQQGAAAGPDQSDAIRRKLAAATNRRQAAETTLAHYRWWKPWVDAYLPRDPFQTLVALIVALLIATVVKDTFLATGTVLVHRVANLATFDLRKQFYRRTLRMDLATFNESGTSDILSRFTYDINSVNDGLQTLFGRAIREPLKMLVCLAGAAYISWQLLLLSLILAPPTGLLVSFLAKTLKRANAKALEQMSSLYGVLVETFSGIKVVKAFTMERHERNRFHKTSKMYYRKAMRIALFDSMVNPITEVMGISMISVAILFGAYLVMNQQNYLWGVKMSAQPLSLSALMVFYAFLAGVSDPARRLTEVFNKLQRAAAASDRVYEMLDREPTVCDPPRPRALPRHHRELVFDRVSFRYTPQQMVLEDIDLRIPFGETIALVGPNGCGKSTLANLIPRFFDPVTGSVQLDGVDLRDVRLRELRGQIGLVNQETLLFDDTVFNNIRYGCPQATPEQVVAAAKQAHAHKFIEQKLDNGYQTIVGQSGGRLSGGQRQRIALARAILRDPAILILDEATSQIDLESEQLIHKVLAQFIRNRTTIIITHRLATLALADRIVVVQGGRITDIGDHDQLLGRCDLYRRLHQIQFRESA